MTRKSINIDIGRISCGRNKIKKFLEIKRNNKDRLSGFGESKEVFNKKTK